MFVREANPVRRLRVARPLTGRTGDVHIRQELDVERDFARPVAFRTAQRARVVGKIPGPTPLPAGVVRRRVQLAQLVMHVGIGRDGRADVDPDRRRVDQLDLPDALGLDRQDMRRQLCPRDVRL